MLSPNDIRARINSYLTTVADGNPTAIAAHYAPNATLEDPVGAPPRTGTAAIIEFYSALADADCDTELLTLRIAGNTAAFHFRVTTRLPGQVIVVEPIDVMTFDDDARITSMRAIWSPDDITTAPTDTQVPATSAATR